LEWLLINGFDFRCTGKCQRTLCNGGHVFTIE
jgi:hypothetical protein